MKLFFDRCMIALAFAGTLTSARAAEQPNVLFIISDDLNNFLGCYGDERAKTPNIDALATRGVCFDRAYCQYPLCGPSRNSMLTGLYPNSTGILNNGQIFRQTIPSQISLPQAFRQAGYFVARLGKLYHYGVPKSIGTDGHDDPASWELKMNPAGVDRLEEMPRTFSLKRGEFGGTPSWYASPKGDSEHTDGMLAANAEWVLERCARQKDRPFFLAVGFFRPHTPYVAPKQYFDLYPAADMPLVTGIEQDQADVPPAALASYRQRNRFTDDLRRQSAQAYYASISFMDAQLGRIVKSLDRLGLSDNTIIVFTSDHGYHIGEHGLWQKMSIFEESARVPLLVVAPGVGKKGTNAETPVGLIDLYSTLSELCGVKAPENLQGQSLVPILKDANAEGRGWALTQVNRNRGARSAKGKRFSGYSLRTSRWRYTEWDEGREGRELYDHETDSKELTNLADDQAHASTVAELSKQLRAAIKSTFPLSGKTPILRDSMWMPNLTDP
ncbi:MAG TPA: sulfatase [Lacipirellulaceae bacterium]